MNLTLIRQKYTPYGGAERFVSQTLTELQQQGLSVSVISRKWKGQSPFPVKTANPFYFGRLWRDSSFAKAVCEAVAQLPAGLVQSHERIPCCDIYRAGDGLHAEWLKQRARYRGKLDDGLTQLSPYHKYTLDAERRLFTSSRLKTVICNSYMVRDEIAQAYEFKPEQLPVIHNGVDTDKFHPRLKQQYRQSQRQQWQIPEDALVFLYLGSGFERKGLRLCVQGLAALNDKNCYLMVVGKDRQSKLYEKLAHKLGVKDQIRFAGPQKDPLPFYGMADVFVLPTLYDPFPNVNMEAMASGLPVITSNKAGTQDIIQHGNNGFVIDALDLDAMQECMRILMDTQKRQTMSQAARTLVDSMSLEWMAAEYLKLYQNLIQSFE